MFVSEQSVKCVIHIIVVVASLRLRVCGVGELLLCHNADPPPQPHNTHLQPVMGALGNFIGGILLQSLNHESLTGVYTHKHTHYYTNTRVWLC